MNPVLPAAGTGDAVNLCMSNNSNQRESTPAAKFCTAWDSPLTYSLQNREETMPRSAPPETKRMN